MKEDWIECKLGDLLKLKNGFAFKSSKYIQEGIPVLKIGDIQDWNVDTNNASRIEENVEYDSHIVSKGDILIAMSGATTGKFGIFDSDEKAYQNQRVGNLLPHSENYTSKKYIFYLLYSLKRKIEKSAYGGAQPNISSGKIESLNTKLFPLPIQKAIVKKIEELFSSLDSGIADLKKAQEQLVIYRQAVLKKAFEGELTKDWRAKQIDLPSAEELMNQIKEERQNHYEREIEEWKIIVKDWEKNGKISEKTPKPKIFKPLESLTIEALSELSELPVGWRWEKNENYLFEVKDGTHDTPKYFEQGIPFITQKNIKNNNVSFEDIKLISEIDHKKFYKRSNVEKGDIIIAMIGHGRGNCCIVNTDKVFSIKNVGLFKFFSSFQNNKYCLHYYKSTLGLNLALKSSKGGAQPFIGLTELRNWALPICSIQEQQQIVREIESRLSVCDKVEESLEESLEKAKALRQSILKKAFEGKLLSAEELAKCKADKDYEPASVLLHKIKKAKNTR